jgi:hypothetical protein
MGDVVIVAFRPTLGGEDALLALVNAHVPMLRALGLATDWPVTVLRAADGTLVEIFEWREGAIAQAHGMPEVAALWARFEAVCQYVRLQDLAEAQQLFATFEPVRAPNA